MCGSCTIPLSCPISLQWSHGVITPYGLANHHWLALVQSLQAQSYSYTLVFNNTVNMIPSLLRVV